MYRVVRIGGRSALYKEGQCLDAGGILPGHLIEFVAGSNVNVARQTKVGPVPMRVAVENTIFGKGPGLTTPTAPQQIIAADAYASGDTVIYQMLGEGDEFMALVANNASAIAVGDYLESAGDGTVRKSSAPGIAASLQLASATSLPTGITLTAVKGGAQGNAIGIIVSSPSGGGSVAVVDNIVTVVPAAASTIAQLVTQLNASANSSDLFTASSTDGTGASNAQASTIAYLTGGLDGGQETANMRACAALTNTSGSPAQLLVEVLS